MLRDGVILLLRGGKSLGRRFRLPIGKRWVIVLSGGLGNCLLRRHCVLVSVLSNDAHPTPPSLGASTGYLTYIA